MAFANSVTRSTTSNGSSYFVSDSPPEKTSSSSPLASDHNLSLQDQSSDISVDFEATGEKVDALSRENGKLKLQTSEKQQTLQARCEKMEEVCEYLKEYTTYLEKKLERTLEEMNETNKNFREEINDLKRQLSTHTHFHKYCPPASSYDPHPKPREERTGRPNF